ncbi:MULTISPECIES: DnaD domain-containing protein [Carnobacterium]|uniref:DNA replication protein DnaD n=2 Tax=Carnobacterium inhibens TaxID=147709 RepID=U5S8R6_9LACT|nr:MULTISPECIES: DnaD domain-containing protein [Carnobacterium]AGY81595.1 DNA replication protein DnaD [Carnobacterium inhibens subsp. gilichinskyi]MBC9824747.1 DnaD domain protein [Carnobacterium inhibens]MCM3512650.1 DnaD domain-containing protein [Carnobacterium inhibens]MDN5371477.1 replication protein [Carnobacterium sp.]
MNNELLQKWLKAGDTTVSNVLLAHYNEVGLNTEQLVLVLQLKSFIDAGNDFPDTEIISKRMQITSSDVFKLIHELINKKLLVIETGKNQDGKTRDSYRLDLLWNKLTLVISQQENQQRVEKQHLSEQELFQLFEAEFGRPLSPIEMQTIGMWLDDDHYAIELIELALREAVLNQVYNLKYVDRILLNWERKNIRTKDQVEKEGNRRRQSSSKAQSVSSKEPTTKVPLHNWLNNNENP